MYHNPVAKQEKSLRLNGIDPGADNPCGNGHRDCHLCFLMSTSILYIDKRPHSFLKICSARVCRLENKNCHKSYHCLKKSSKINVFHLEAQWHNDRRKVDFNAPLVMLFQRLKQILLLLILF